MKAHLAALTRSRLLRFLVVGGANTAIGYGIFCGLFALIGQWCPYWLVAVLAHLVAVFVAFQTQRWFVFGTHGGWWTSFLRFNLSQLATLGLGLGLLTAQVEWLGLHPLLAQALAIPPTVAIAFVLHRSFSFRVRSAGDSGQVGGSPMVPAASGGLVPGPEKGSRCETGAVPPL